MTAARIKTAELAGAMKYVADCFDAADIEGLQQALAETTDERLKDLVTRRLLYAAEMVRAIVTKYDFNCEAGPLANCKEFQGLQASVNLFGDEVEAIEGGRG